MSSSYCIHAHASDDGPLPVAATPSPLAKPSPVAATLSALSLRTVDHTGRIHETPRLRVTSPRMNGWNKLFRHHSFKSLDGIGFHSETQDRPDETKMSIINNDKKFFLDWVEKVKDYVEKYGKGCRPQRYQEDMRSGYWSNNFS